MKEFRPKFALPEKDDVIKGVNPNERQEVRRANELVLAAERELQRANETHAAADQRVIRLSEALGSGQGNVEEQSEQLDEAMRKRAIAAIAVKSYEKRLEAARQAVGDAKKAALAEIDLDTERWNDQIQREMDKAFEVIEYVRELELARDAAVQPFGGKRTRGIDWPVPVAVDLAAGQAAMERNAVVFQTPVAVTRSAVDGQIQREATASDQVGMRSGPEGVPSEWRTRLQTSTGDAGGDLGLARLHRRAPFAPMSFNADDRTVELVFSAGAPVKRYDPRTGSYYSEKLSLQPSAVRLGRLNAGAPLLNSHASDSLEDQIGVVVERSARIEKGLAVATVRFSDRESVRPILEDVRAGILKGVSVGYVVHRFEEISAKDGALAVRTAVDWEPYEISLVPIPADAAAQTRSAAADADPREEISGTSRDVAAEDAARVERLERAKARTSWS